MIHMLANDIQGIFQLRQSRTGVEVCWESGGSGSVQQQSFKDILGFLREFLKAARRLFLYSVLPLFKISRLPSPDASSTYTQRKGHFFRFVILIQQVYCTLSTIFQYLCTSLLFHMKASISKYGALYAGVNGTFVPKITFNSFSNCDQLCRLVMTEMPIKLLIGNDTIANDLNK
jgi:hypothetical protein